MIRQLHQWNAGLSFVLSAALNATLFWLVALKTPKEMRQFSAILLQTAAVDVCFSAIGLLAQPINFSVNGSTYEYLNGLLGQQISSSTTKCVLFNSFNLLLYFSIAGQSVQFLYRYLLLVRNVKLALSKYFLLLSIPFLATLAFCVLLYLDNCPTPSTKLLQNAQIAQLLELGAENGTQIPVAFVGETKFGLLDVATLLLMFLIFASNTLIIVFCGYRIHRYMRAHIGMMDGASALQKRAFNLNKELTRSLICLALLPICTQIGCAVAIPFSLLLDSSLVRTNVTLVQMMVAIPDYWVPALSPFIAIVTVKSYRRLVVRSIKRLTLLQEWTSGATTVPIGQARQQQPNVNVVNVAAAAAGGTSFYHTFERRTPPMAQIG